MSTTEIQRPDLLTVEQVRALVPFPITRRTVHNWTTAGVRGIKLPSVKVANRTLYPTQSLFWFLQETGAAVRNKSAAAQTIDAAALPVASTSGAAACVVGTGGTGAPALQ